MGLTLAHNVAKASVSIGSSHTCLGGERVDGRSRCTSLGRESSHSRTRSFFCRLEAWCLARSTSWWLGKRVDLSKSSREDGRRRAGGRQSQKVYHKAKRDDRSTSLTASHKWLGWERRKEAWPPSSSLESYLAVHFVRPGATVSCHLYHHRSAPQSHP